MQITSTPILARGLVLRTINPCFAILTFLTTAVLVALIVARYAAHHWQGNVHVAGLGFAGLTTVYTSLMLYFDGFTSHTIRGVLLCLILLTASYSDLKSRKADDYLSVMVLLTAFVGCTLAQLPEMLLGGIFTGGLMLTVSLLGKESCIGGADIKLGSACSFALGISRGITGLMLGLILAIVINFCRGKNTRNRSFPMVPYLSAGFLAAYLI